MSSKSNERLIILAHLERLWEISSTPPEGRGFKAPLRGDPEGFPKGGLKPCAQGGVDLIALVLGSELLYHNCIPQTMFILL